MSKKKRQSPKAKLAERVGAVAARPKDMPPAAHPPAESLFIETAKNDPLRRLLSALTNPDDLIAELSDGIAVYRTMMRDPYVKSAVKQKKDAILGLNWHVNPADDSPVAETVAQFVDHAFLHVQGGLEANLRPLLESVNDGYSVSELNWTILARGRFVGRIGLKNVKGKPPENIEFRCDEFNNITKIRSSVLGKGEDLDPAKFVHMTHDALYNDPHGRSDLRAAYRAFIIKDTLLRFWAIYLQKFGQPTVVGKYPRGASQNEKKALKLAIKSIQEDTGITVPEDLILEFLETSGSTRGEYQAAVDVCNKEILISVLGAYLQSSEGTTTGARNMGMVHKDTTFLFIDALRRALEEVVNSQIISRLVDLNFIVAEYPRFSFNVEPDEDLEKKMLIVEKAVNLGADVPTWWFHETFGIPAAQEGDDVLKPPAATGGGPFGFSGKPALEFSRVARFAEHEAIRVRMVDVACDPDDLEEIAFHTRNIDEELTLVARAVQRGAGVFGKINEHLKRALKKNPNDVAILSETEKKEIARALYEPAVTADLLGRYHYYERFVKRYGAVEKHNLGVVNFAQTIAAPLSPEAALAFFKSKIPLTREAFDQMESWRKHEAFSMAGDYEEHVIAAVQKSLEKAIGEGVPVKGFLDDMDGVFERLGLEGPTQHHLKTIYRMNLRSSYAKGKIAQGLDPAVAEVITHRRYWTKNDGAVRPTHAALHGLVREKDDPFWRKYYAPWEWGCRCTVTDVTKYDWKRKSLRAKLEKGLKMQVEPVETGAALRRDLIGEVEQEMSHGV